MTRWCSFTLVEVERSDGRTVAQIKEDASGEVVVVAWQLVVTSSTGRPK